MGNKDLPRRFFVERTYLPGGLALWMLAGCSATGLEDGSSNAEQSVAVSQQALTEDGLAEAYELFKRQFEQIFGFAQVLRMGYGHHAGLSTEQLATAEGHTPKGQAQFFFAEGRLVATLDDVPAGHDFDLWFVKNVAGSSKNVVPEAGDQFFRVGPFSGTTPNGGKSLDVNIGANIDFDLDLIVVTRAGQHPSASRVAVGARTLFEKRFLRERSGGSLDPVTGPQADTVETNDPLVRRGAFLFFNETFGGNGRTCGTCHRAENNLTIDAGFIATLPSDDPLFVAERVPALGALENSALLRSDGLILENLDGFDNPGVLRGVPHTFAQAPMLGMNAATSAFPQSPPDQRVGWGGDGAPGRGTLHEFAFGAIIQHFPKALERRVGIDFRVPTQAELDALEAFQLFTGRQKLVDARPLALRDQGAEQGRDLFLRTLSGGKCANCHLDMGSLDGNDPNAVNFNVATNTRALRTDLPEDDGFLGPHPNIPVLLGDGSFNVPPVIEAADTAAGFHNNSALDIEASVEFYTRPEFQNSPVGQATDIQITPEEVQDIAAFLRVLNAAENIRQVRKRIEFVRANRSAGNDTILDVAIADAQDALDVLAERGLNPSARHSLATVKQTLLIARAQPDANRPAYIDHALVYLALAKGDLFVSNPNSEF